MDIINNDLICYISSKLDSHSLFMFMFTNKEIYNIIINFYGKRNLKLLQNKITSNIEKIRLCKSNINAIFRHNIYNELFSHITYGQCEQCQWKGFLKSNRVFCWERSSYQSKYICIENCKHKCPSCNKIKTYSNFSSFKHTLTYPVKLHSMSEYCFQCFNNHLHP